MLASPSFNGLLHQKVSGALGVPILVVTIDDDHHYLVVTEPVPYAVGSHHENLVVGAQVREVGDLGLSGNTDASRSHVTD